MPILNYLQAHRRVTGAMITLLIITIGAWLSPSSLYLAVQPAFAQGIGSAPGLVQTSTPPMGFANWNSLGCNYNAKKIKAIADKMVSSGMRSAGYKYLIIQECIAKKRDAQGNLVPVAKRFPHGLKPLANYIHSKGLKAGIYTDAGRYTCAHYAGSYGHEKRDVAQFAAWGFDLVEVDWCNIPYGDFPRETHAQVARILYSRWRNAIATLKRPLVLYACNGWDPATDPWSWGPDIANMWRTGPDVAPVNDIGHMRWKNIVRNFDINARHPRATGRGHFNDPDMLGVGLPGISGVEGRAMFSLWAMSAAPLLVGTDITNSSQFTKATRKTYLNREVIAIDQDPLGVQARLVLDNRQGHQVWRKPLANGDVAVALFNRTQTAAIISTTAQAMGLPPANRYTVHNLWTHKRTATAGKIAARVKSHQVQLFRVSIAGAKDGNSQLAE